MKETQVENERHSSMASVLLVTKSWAMGVSMPHSAFPET